MATREPIKETETPEPVSVTESPLRPGDKMSAAPQRDGSYNVTVRLATLDGQRAITLNVTDPAFFARRMRYMVDNPPAPDLEGERKALLEKRTDIDSRIAEIDRVLNA